MESATLYELDKPVQQMRGTWQCWWLALLEVARVSGKLEPSFKEQGTLGKFYEKRRAEISAKGADGKGVPNEGELPEGLVEKHSDLKAFLQINPKTGPVLDSAKTKFFVYGPEWQRMVMFFLLETSDKAPWNMPAGTVNTSDRAKVLTLLLQRLGVKGISFGKEHNVTGFELGNRVDDLDHNQYLILDKANSDKSIRTGHCMAGIVERVPTPETEHEEEMPKQPEPSSTFKSQPAKKTKLEPIDKKKLAATKTQKPLVTKKQSPEPKKSRTYNNKILVYNQSIGRTETLPCMVQRVGNKEGLISESASKFLIKSKEQKWVINWFLPVNIVSPVGTDVPGTGPIKSKL
ncbi:unnamed protein product [Clonostachys byssicola]|uniref:Uncharacterized protein n=1 Tax=Clonostachys byssicola TaxID=160290 RepID=A0A9N9TZ15_9HYPO|nr:unnamed protein product [Clonostachys byssicola]